MNFSTLPSNLHVSQIEHDPSIMNSVISKSRFIYVDIDGCYADNTEPHQMKAFTQLLNEETGAQYDYRIIAKEMLGKPERVIIEEFKLKYDLQGDTDALLEKRTKLYVNAIHNSDVHPTPEILVALEAAKQICIPRVVLSNGREVLIRHFLKHWKTENIFDEIHSIDSTERVAFNKDFAINNKKGAKADKVDFLIYHAKKNNIPLHETTFFEDSEKTLRRAETFRINCVFVEHEYNRSKYIPNTGIVIKLNGPR